MTHTHKISPLILTEQVASVKISGLILDGYVIVTFYLAMLYVVLALSYCAGRVTFSAAGPFWPCTTSNSTNSPSLRDL